MKKSIRLEPSFNHPPVSSNQSSHRYRLTLIVKHRSINSYGGSSPSADSPLPLPTAERRVLGGKSKIALHAIGRMLPGRMLSLRAVVCTTAILFSFLTISALGEDTEYQTKIKALRQRLWELDAKRNDYRRIKPDFTPEMEAQRERVLGQLIIDDPMWVLEEEIQAELDAFVELPMRERAENQKEALEMLKDFAAIVSSVFDEVAATRELSERYANVLRRFILTRDVNGANAWSERILSDRTGSNLKK